MVGSGGGLTMLWLADPGPLTLLQIPVCCSVLQCVSMCYCMLPCAHGGVAELLHGLRASAYGSDAAEWCGCCHMAFCSVQLLEI